MATLLLRVSLLASALVLAVIAGHARSAAPLPISDAEKVRRFYALPEGAAVRLGDLTFRQGSSPVAAFSHDGRSYYTVGGYGEVCVWDLATRKLVRRFDLAPLRSTGSKIVALPDGSLAVFGGFVLLVDPVKGTILREIRMKDRDDWFYCETVSPDGKVIAAGGRDGKIRLFYVATGKPIPFAGAHPVRKEQVMSGLLWHLAFSPDGKQLLSDGWFDRQRLWDVKTGKEVRNFRPDEVAEGAAAFSPDGKLFAVPRPSDPKKPDKRPFVTALCRVEPFGDAVKLRDPEWAYDVAFRPDGRLLVAGSTTLVGWDVKTGERRFTTDRLPYPHGYLTFSRDNKHAVFQGRWFDLDTGKEQLIESGHVGGITDVALSDKVAVTAADDGFVRGWDSKTGEQLWNRRLDKEAPVPISLAFSPKGDEFAVLDLDYVVRVLDAATGKERRRMGPIVGQGTVVRWSPDGKWIAAGGGSYNVFLFSADDGKLRKRFVGYDGSMNAHWHFAFSPDGKSLVAPAHYGGTDVRGKTGFPKPRKTEYAADEYDPRLGPPNDPDDPKTYLALWDVASGKRLRLLGEGERMRDLLFSQDGKTVAVRREGNLHLHDAASGKEVRKFTVPWEPLTSFRGRTLMVGGRAIDVEKGTASRVWPVQPRCAAVSPDGKRMLTAGQDDSTALLWEVGR